MICAIYNKFVIIESLLQFFITFGITNKFRVVKVAQINNNLIKKKKQSKEHNKNQIIKKYNSRILKHLKIELEI